MGLLDKISKKDSSTEDESKDAQQKAQPEKTEKKPAEESGKSQAKKDDTQKEAGAKKSGQKSVKSEKKTQTKKASGKKEEKGSTKKVTDAMFAYEIIREPVLTEKGDRAQMNNQYIFYVSRDANKVEIAQAVKELYGVKPTSVNVINTKGKSVRFGRLQGTRKDRKKAVVTLKQGDTISITE